MHGTLVTALILISCLVSYPTFLCQAQTPSTTQTSTSRAAVDKIDITPSKETTYFLGPVNPDGTIDYLAALNEYYGKGVTRENNAAIPLLKAVGPTLVGSAVRGQVLKRLDLSSLPEQGDYFVGLGRFIKDKKQREEQLEKVMDGPWTAEQYPDISEWLKANEASLRMVTIATRRPRYYIPLMAKWKSVGLVSYQVPRIHIYRSIAKALVARAMLRLGSGQPSRTWEDLIAVHRLGRLLRQGPTFVHHLTGMAIEAMTFEADCALARSEKPFDSAGCMADLQSLFPAPDYVTVIDVGDRCTQLDLVMVLARSGPKALDEAFEVLACTGTEVEKGTPKGSNLHEGSSVASKMQWGTMRKSVDWNEALRQVNAYVGRLVNAHRKGTYQERVRALEHFDRAVERDYEILLKRMQEFVHSEEEMERFYGVVIPRIIRTKRHSARGHTATISQDVGRMVAVPLSLSLRKTHELHYQHEMGRGLSVVAMALAGHKAANGTYPKKLDSLTPKCLRKIPPDLFADKPLEYQRRGEGYVLYSVGPNMKDDGGKDSDDDDEEGTKGYDDIVVRCEP